MGYSFEVVGPAVEKQECTTERDVDEGKPRFWNGRGESRELSMSEGRRNDVDVEG